MEYENREVPEGINVSEENPLKEFLILTLGVGALTLLVVFMLAALSSWLLPYVPFSVEKKLGVPFAEQLKSGSYNKSLDHNKIENYLQELADELVIAQGLPDEMSITVHYVDDDTVNAFASLGGHVFIHRGLLEKIGNENTLAQLLGHEIAHIKHRDPLLGIARSMLLVLLIEALLGDSAGSFSGSLVGEVSLLASLSFTREQEEKADIEALRALEIHYGHVGGAKDLYQIFVEEMHGNEPIEFLSTHPLNQNRLDSIEYFPALKIGQLNPLPDFISTISQ